MSKYHLVMLAAIGIMIIIVTMGISAAQADARVHPQSGFRAEVAQIIKAGGLDSVALAAYSIHNDLEVWVDRAGTMVLDAISCDQQRNYAADLWGQWSELVEPAGASVTVKSYTGRVLASAEYGWRGARYHCE